LAQEVPSTFADDSGRVTDRSEVEPRTTRRAKSRLLGSHEH